MAQKHVNVDGHKFVFIYQYCSGCMLFDADLGSSKCLLTGRQEQRGCHVLKITTKKEVEHADYSTSEVEEL